MTPSLFALIGPTAVPPWVPTRNPKAQYPGARVSSESASDARRVVWLVLVML